MLSDAKTAKGDGHGEPSDERKAMLRRVALTVVTAVAGVLMFAAAPANAVEWGPLKAYDGGIKRAEGYGGFYNSGNTYARMRATYRDPYADGDGAFVHVSYYFYGPDELCDGACWYAKGYDRTSNVGTADGWVTRYEQQTLEERAEKARGTIHVCVDQSWQPDECSDNAYPSFAY